MRKLTAHLFHQQESLERSDLRQHKVRDSVFGLVFSNDLKMHNTAAKIALRFVDAFCDVGYREGTQALRTSDGDGAFIVLRPNCSLVGFPGSRSVSGIDS